MRIPSPFFTSFKETPPKAEHLRKFNKKINMKVLILNSYGTLPNLLLRGKKSLSEVLILILMEHSLTFC